MGRWIFLILLPLLASSHFAFAQYDGSEDEFFDDEDGVEDNVPDEPIDSQRASPQRPGSRPGFVPPINSNRIPPATPRPLNRAAENGALEFRLVDPPKYWQPKKRRALLKEKNNSQQPKKD